MAEKPRKTIEQLTQDVLESGVGLMTDKDLETLFSEETPANPGQAQTQTQSLPPTQVGNQAQTGTPGTPATGTPGAVDSNGIVQTPQGDQGSLDQETKSLREQVAQQNARIEQLTNLMESLKQPEQQYQQPVQQQTQEDPDSDIDDAIIIEKPKENIKKLAQREAARIVIAALTNYDSSARRERAIEAFKATRPDFDGLRPEMSKIVKEFPQLNRDPDALPKIYELAKTRAAKKNQELRTGLGLDQMDALKKEIQELKAQSGMTVEQAKAKLLEEIKKRRSASGTLPASSAISQDDRATMSSKTTPLTPEEKQFDDILNSGPARLAF